MSISRGPAALRAAAAAVGAALVVGGSGCTLLHSDPRPAPGVTLTLGRCAPSAEVAILDRGPSGQAWPEFQHMVTGTARCGEHLIVIDAGSGRQLGSFVAPPAPTVKAPAPPPPLAPGATSFQVSEHKKAVAGYRALIRDDLARLLGRARRQLSAWASQAVAKVSDRSGVGLDPSGNSLAAALNSAAADLTSLRLSGVRMGDRTVLAVLGLRGLAESAPKLSAGLRGACVTVTGFPSRPALLRAWQSELGWQGARRVVLLTRAIAGQLPAVVGSCLTGR